MKKWFEDAWWSWGNCISFRFVDYNDNIDRCAFFEELNYGWCQMEDQELILRISTKLGPNWNPSKSLHMNFCKRISKEEANELEGK